MNDQTRKPKARNQWTADHEAAVRCLADAAQQVQAVDTPVNRQQLKSAVDAARDAGVGWTKIGDTLGIASGNAYQRYRRRGPGSADAGQRCGADGSRLPTAVTQIRHVQDVPGQE